MIFVVVRPKSLLSRHFLIGGLINELLGFVSFNKKQRNGMKKKKKKASRYLQTNNRSYVNKVRDEQ